MANKIFSLIDNHNFINNKISLKWYEDFMKYFLFSNIDSNL